MYWRFGLAARAAVVAAVVAACGGGSGSNAQHYGSTSGAGTASILAGYRHAVASANNILAGHAGFDVCGAQFNARQCHQWAQADEPYEKQALAALQRAKVPPQLGVDNSQIIALIRRSEHDDVLLVRATAHAGAQSGPTPLALRAAGDFDGLVTGKLLPLMHQVDPSISSSLP